MTCDSFRNRYLTVQRWQKTNESNLE
jgi:hypothetical protein